MHIHKFTLTVLTVSVWLITVYNACLLLYVMSEAKSQTIRRMQSSLEDWDKQLEEIVQKKSQYGQYIIIVKHQRTISILLKSGILQFDPFPSINYNVMFMTSYIHVFK